MKMLNAAWGIFAYGAGGMLAVIGGAIVLVAETLTKAGDNAKRRHHPSRQRGQP